MIIIKNIDAETAAMLRGKINALLNEVQKKELMNKIQRTDKAGIENMLRNINTENLDKRQIISMLNSIDKKDLMEKLKRL